MNMKSEKYRKFIDERIAEGKRIDPATAEVLCHWAHCLDPYGVLDDLPEEFTCAGRSYFFRAPGSDIWVEFSDLPKATRRALNAKRVPTFSI
jgi:hypothetical protein